jgi:hypothetical protein
LITHESAQTSSGRNCRHSADRPLAELVPDAIDDGLSEVRLQRAVAAMLEAIQMLQGCQDRVLHEIRRIGDVPSPARKTARGPPPEDRDVAVEQAIQRGLVTRAHTVEQVARRLVVGWLWIAGHPVRCDCNRHLAVTFGPARISRLNVSQTK